MRTAPCRSNVPILRADYNEVLGILRRKYIGIVAERGMDIDFEAADKDTARAARWLTDTDDEGHRARPWLFLSGNVGTGKTTLMKAIARTLTESGMSARMFRASDFPVLFLNNVEQTERQIMRGEWCRVLLLDDIGVEATEIKEYGNTIQPFVKIVEERYNRQLPLIVSSNLSGDEFRERYGERTIDRIKEMATGIRYEGKSYRK